MSKCTMDAENVYAPLVMRFIWSRKRTLAVDQNGSVDASFDPPLFSSDSTFNPWWCLLNQCATALVGFLICTPMAGVCLVCAAQGCLLCEAFCIPMAGVCLVCAAQGCLLCEATDEISLFCTPMDAVVGKSRPNT